MTEYLTTEQLWLVARELGVDSVRDMGLLDSAAHRPSTVFFGQEVYPTIHEKAAVLLEAISRNHALVDGNKRLAWVATAVFYGLNGISLQAPFDEAYELVIAVCTGAMDSGESAKRLAQWCSPVTDHRRQKSE